MKYVSPKPRNLENNSYVKNAAGILEMVSKQNAAKRFGRMTETSARTMVTHTTSVSAIPEATSPPAAKPNMVRESKYSHSVAVSAERSRSARDAIDPNMWISRQFRRLSRVLASKSDFLSLLRSAN